MVRIRRGWSGAFPVPCRTRFREPMHPSILQPLAAFGHPPLAPFPCDGRASIPRILCRIETPQTKRAAYGVNGLMLIQKNCWGTEGQTKARGTEESLLSSVPLAVL